MTGKGTPSFGGKNKLTHIRCRRCGRHSYHTSKKSCSACGFGRATKLRTYSWQWKGVTGKANRRK